MTAYGRAVTEKIVSELARAGVVIISGLAYGIDAIGPPGGSGRRRPNRGRFRQQPLTRSTRPQLQSGHADFASNGTLISEYPTATTPIQAILWFATGLSAAWRRSY